MQRPAEQQAHHEEEHAGSIEEQRVRQPAQGKKRQADSEDDDAVRRFGRAPDDVEQESGENAAHGLDRSQRALLPDQTHHEHGRRGDDIALRQALQDGQQLHPVPEPVIAEEDER